MVNITVTGLIPLCKTSQFHLVIKSPGFRSRGGRFGLSAGVPGPLVFFFFFFPIPSSLLPDRTKPSVGSCWCSARARGLAVSVGRDGIRVVGLGSGGPATPSSPLSLRGGGGVVVVVTTSCCGELSARGG